MKTVRNLLAIAALAVLAVGGPACKGSTGPSTMTGTIQIASNPTGATVFLDGVDKGMTTNCSLTNVSAGNHMVKLIKDGYADYQAAAAVTAGKTTAFNATLTAAAPAALAVTPATGLTASGSAGGPFTPASQDFTLQNTGGSSLSWTAAAGQAWATAAPASGMLAAGASVTVTVSINAGANALAAGTYSANITFTNATNGNGTSTRPVSLSVLGTSQIVFVTVDYTQVTPLANPNGNNNMFLNWTYPGYVGNQGLANVSGFDFTSPQVRLATETIIHMWVVDDKEFNGTTSTVCAILKINGHLVDVGTTVYGEAVFILGNDGVVRKAI
jgi:hypothetical protein